MNILVLFPILMGAGLGMQTAVNAKLRTFVESPYLASAISFTIGAIFLCLITLISGSDLLVTANVFRDNPAWIWIGGLLGTIGLTINLLLFSKLGGIQAAVLPIFGQIIMGVVIDQFGLFNAPQSILTVKRGLGLMLVVIGVFVTIGMMKRNKLVKKPKEQQLLPWQIIGVAGGMLTALQAAINGQLGTVLGSPIQAAAISFTIGAIVLIIVSIITKADFNKIQSAVKNSKDSWWIWIGGFLGSIYVFGMAWLVPKIGTGQVVVMALFGQLLFSALVENFGLFRSIKIPINSSKVMGLVIMLTGVLIVHFL